MDWFVLSLLAPLAGALLLSGLDDLFVDLVWGWAWLKSQFRPAASLFPPAVSASAIRDADEALDWALAPLISSRIRQEGGALLIEPFDLPRELKRRLLLAAFAELGAAPPRGPDLLRALEAIERGETVTLSGLKLEGGTLWRLSLAPPRRT